MSEREQDGCELCGDWPSRLSSKCHPTAPLKVEMLEGGILVLSCYVPECGREVARFWVLAIREAERGETTPNYQGGPGTPEVSDE